MPLVMSSVSSVPVEPCGATDDCFSTSSSVLRWAGEIVVVVGKGGGTRTSTVAGTDSSLTVRFMLSTTMAAITNASAPTMRPSQSSPLLRLGPASYDSVVVGMTGAAGSPGHDACD